MLPVLTRPLGFKNEILLSLLTSYNRTASAKEFALGAIIPFVTAPLAGLAAAAADEAAALLRKSSAQDLGAAFSAGTTVSVGVSAAACEVESVGVSFEISASVVEGANVG